MKILLVNKYWYLRGGAEKVLFTTKKLLEENGHTVEIFGMQHPENVISNEFFINNIDYHAPGFWKGIRNGLKVIYNKDARDKFELLVKKFQPDVIHFHNIYHQLSFSLFDVVKKYNLPVVMTLHDYQLISPNYNLFSHRKIDESCTKGKYYKCLLNNCLENRGFSLVATISAYFCKWKNYKSYIKKYISPSQFLKDKFVANGFSEDMIIVLGNPVLVKQNKYQAGKYVTFLGRLAPDKGLEVFLQTAKLLPARDFKIIGTGPMETKLKQKVIKDSILNVEFLGFKQGQELEQLLSGSSLVVLPSVWYENCPLAALEAIANGKLVLASNIGGLPEILPVDLLFKTGEATDLAERITFWGNQSLEKRTEKSQELKNRILENYNPEKYLKSLLAVYDEVVKQ